MPDRPPYYLTTPIYYVNARPHLGTAYSTIVTDTIARYKRAQGFDVFFLTGTDEHGQKIEQSARKAGKSPQEFTDTISAEFRQTWENFGFGIDYFQRTTSDDHARKVQELYQRCKDRGYIYKSSYTGYYSVVRVAESRSLAPDTSGDPWCDRIEKLRGYLGDPEIRGAAIFILATGERSDSAESRGSGSSETMAPQVLGAAARAGSRVVRRVQNGLRRARCG